MEVGLNPAAFGLNPAAFGLWALVPLLLLIGGIVLIVVTVVVVWLAATVGSRGVSPSGGQTIFELGWAIHNKLESCDARIERLESRLLEHVDGPRTPGRPATIRDEEGSQ
jgi:hypothetical protein